MLVASQRIELLDRYRVPYEVGSPAPVGMVRIGRLDGRGPELLAPSTAPTDAPSAYTLDGGITVYGHLVRRPETGGSTLSREVAWQEEAGVYDQRGARCGAIERAPDGSVFVPFDLNEPFDVLLNERYVPEGTSRVSELGRSAYYRVRPILPYRVQMGVRRRFQRIQERSTFPGWPVEPALHQLEALLLGLIETIAGEPLPWVAPWPDGYAWCVALTHDVEARNGYNNVGAVREVEARSGLRSAWYFVPEKDYKVEEMLLDELRAADCEIGLHGLKHDGRDLAVRTFDERLPAMHSYAEAWGARGFRGPSTLRSRELIERLGFDHDSSWSDVARYEPQAGGTCSWLPFFIGRVVELPITLPQDHTLFELTRTPDAASWFEKAAYLKHNGGMALILTHPDYLIDQARLAVYEKWVVEQAGDSSAWHALPREIASWWRSRAATNLVRDGATWVAEGPAAGSARIRIGAPEPPAPFRGKETP